MWVVIIICAFVTVCAIAYARSCLRESDALRGRLKACEESNIFLKKEVKETQEEIQKIKRSHEREVKEVQGKAQEKIHEIKQLHAKENVKIRYKLDYMTLLYPDIDDLFDGEQIVLNEDDVTRRVKNLFETVDIIKKPKSVQSKEIISLKERISFLEAMQSNLTAIPYMSALMADYETYGIEVLAKQLDWGYSWQREKKVASIRDIRKAAKEMVERNLEAKYQLAYLIELFPALENIIETDFKQLPILQVEDLSEYDKTRDWLSKEEYQTMSSTERNQLALDRYRNSHNKTKWQIGRDYELYVGYVYSKKGYTIDYFGSYMGVEDLGRDLIAKKGNSILIIQCKYWSQEKTIHEKHITQLYGTMACYCMEKGVPSKNVKGVLVTNIQLSEQAKKMADYLKIHYIENLEKGEYPCIKCNIGRDGSGETKIYHLPFDQQYDATKIDSKGEFFAMTVKEAEDAGFRRAFKWFMMD